MPSRAASAWRSCTGEEAEQAAMDLELSYEEWCDRWKGRAFAQWTGVAGMWENFDPPTWGCAPELVHAGPVDRFLDCGYRCVRPCHQRRGYRNTPGFASGQQRPNTACCRS